MHTPYPGLRGDTLVLFPASGSIVQKSQDSSTNATHSSLDIDTRKWKGRIRFYWLGNMIRGLLTSDDGRLMPACAEVTSGRAGERTPALGHSVLSDQREVVYLPILRQGTIQFKFSNLDLLQT
ncbi:hypothetical protein B296_00023660 [Ensete ventricosum]|uniref:Uncharacterized protein n=1 Tax=Ensete ventricosum TaxID=4639 RepID=A0A426ZSH3_ENSVE|nr:hypothetical protein B296_00023660 [Ensete ventricosum]